MLNSLSTAGCGFLALLLFWSNDTLAQKRVALVIGNSEYADAPLLNPLNDALDMDLTLKKFGFEVTRLDNADQRTMERAIRTFSSSLDKETVGLFYFAGHGLQVDGANYLVPLNAEIETESDVRYEAVALGRVLDGMSRAEGGLNMVILDACRNNPYSRSFRSMQRGLSRAAPTVSGTIIMYATEPGDVASDGTGRNGIFTGELISALETSPQANIEQIFKQTSNRVYKKTRGDQSPWSEGVIRGEFSFAAAGIETTAVNDTATYASPLAAPSSNAIIDKALWDAVKEENTAESYNVYLSQFQNGMFAGIARLKLKQLNQALSASQNTETISKPPDTFIETDYGFGELGVKLFLSPTDPYSDSSKRRAFKYYQRECLSNEDLSACYKYALLNLEYGVGGYENQENFTHEIWRTGCDKGEFMSCALLGVYLSTDGGAETEEEEREALELLGLACDGNIAYACAMLGWVHYQPKFTQRDIQRAIAYFETACQKGDVEKGCPLGAHHLLSGEDMPIDPQRALRLLQVGCAQVENSTSCAELNRFRRTDEYKTLISSTANPERMSYEPAMMAIPAGQFSMGSPNSEAGRSSDESQHEVTVSSFKMSKYETTFAEYDEFAKAIGRKLPISHDASVFGSGRGNHPVVNVDWQDATDYAQWLSEKTGKRYRLPTEAEWEYAARGGSQGIYSWGNYIGVNRANCYGCGIEWEDVRTVPVGKFSPNDWGLYDMHGNVREWTCSLYNHQYAGEEEKCAQIHNSADRALRDGAWNQQPHDIRSANRRPNSPSGSGGNVGFRLVQEY